MTKKGTKQTTQEVANEYNPAIGDPPPYFSQTLSDIWNEIRSDAPRDSLSRAERTIVEYVCHLKLAMQQGCSSAQAVPLSSSQGAQLLNALRLLGCSPADRKKAIKVEKEKGTDAFSEFE
jgi:hypothetical protein